jgi:hypothetical protein
MIERTFTTGDGEEVIVTIQAIDEGIVIDFFQGDECIATIARTYEEWLDSALPNGNDGTFFLVVAPLDECNTCGGTQRWMTTTEDSPTELVDLGPCPDCVVTTDTNTNDAGE